MLTGLLTGRSSPNRKSQFPTCEEGETGCSRLRAHAHRPVSRGVSFGQMTAWPMRSPAVRCELQRGWNSAILGEMSVWRLRGRSSWRFSLSMWSPATSPSHLSLPGHQEVLDCQAESAAVTVIQPESSLHRVTPLMTIRESPTTADPSGPCRERRAPRWRSPALPVAWASLIDRCQQQHRGAIWPVGACRRLVDSCGDGSLELGGLGVEAVG